jgi:integrase
VMESVAEVRGERIIGSTKTGATRAVTWPEILDEAIDTHLAALPLDPDGFVFPNSQGKPIGHASFMQHHFKPALARAGLPDTIRFHDLRHTHASLLIAMGAHPKAIQERLGHSSITVTLDVYGHLFPGVGDELARGLDALVRGAIGHELGTTEMGNVQ